jgi:hypothetical protein
MFLEGIFTSKGNALDMHETCPQKIILVIAGIKLWSKALVE